MRRYLVLLLLGVATVALAADVTIYDLTSGTPDYDDEVEYQISGGGASRKTTVGALRGEIGTAGVDASILAKPQVNSLDTSAVGSIIAGGGDSGTSSRNSTYGEGGGSNSEANEIGEGPAYVAGGADYATISGGYDNRNDQIAGTITGGAHHLLQSYGTHGWIGGGSHAYQLGPSDRSAIITGGGANTTPNLIGQQLAVSQMTWSAGTVVVDTTAAHKLTSGQDVAISGATQAGYNTVPGAAVTITATDADTFTFPLVADPGASPATGTPVVWTSCDRCLIGAGRTLTIRSGLQNGILLGDTNAITSGGNYNTILGGNAVTIDLPSGSFGATTSTDFAAAGGNTVTLREDYGFAFGNSLTTDGLATAVFGSGNTVSTVGDYGLAVGNTNTLGTADSFVWGERASTVSEASMCHSKGLQTGEVSGGAQRCVVTDHRQTSSTSATTLFNITVLDHTAIVCDVMVSVRGQAGSPPSVSAWKQTYTAYRTNSGNVTQLALTNTDLIDDLTATDPSLAADTTFRLSITPPSTATLNWMASADCIFNTGA